MNRLLFIALSATTLLSCNQNEPTQQVYQVNGEVSKAEWKGSAPTHFHTGSLQITGSLNTTNEGKIGEGNFTIPISSIECYDLQDSLKIQLLSHLKTVDFFNMAVHPNATFRITKAEEKEGEGNYLLTGDFTMIGQTHPISFPAHIEKTGDSLIIKADFTIDRLKWGMNSYSDSTAPLYILPEVEIHLDVRAGKQ